MALDVYVGSLTRYYMEDWETPIQRHCRETGKEFIRVRVNEQNKGTDDVVNDPEVVRSYVAAWRESLNTALSEIVSSPVDWDETSSSPYFSEQLRWDNLSSLKLWAAYLEKPEFKRPTKCVEDWTTDEAFKAVDEPNDTKYPSLIRHVTAWLPVDRNRLVFDAQEINGNTTTFSTLLGLRDELNEINELTWKADSVTIERWKRDGTEKNAPLEDGAKFGFALLFTLANTALEHKLAMRLDG